MNSKKIFFLSLLSLTLIGIESIPLVGKFFGDTDFSRFLVLIILLSANNSLNSYFKNKIS